MHSAEWQAAASAMLRGTVPKRDRPGSTEWRPLGSSTLSTTWLLTADEQRYFVKTNAAARLSMFEAEADGLRAIEATHAIRVPHAVASGSAGGTAFLILEFLALETEGCSGVLGEALARLHRVSAPTFGWQRDNTIGLTPQGNTPSADWTTFWGERRLRPQLELAAANGFRGRLQSLGAVVLERLPALLEGHRPAPSLVHGDLWGGNWACTSAASPRRGAAGAGGERAAAHEPVIFDPAVYYGDRETDLAMTELFGGFDRAFYAAYERSWPLDAGYPRRRPLYQVYHVLNHLNLFGAAYLRRAEAMLGALSTA